MLRPILFSVIFLFPSAFVYAADVKSISLSHEASYVDEGDISTNIREECYLPKQQIQDLVEALQNQGFIANLVEVMPSEGLFLKAQIKNALSSGNAFIGHRKLVTTKAILYRNGVEVAATTLTRDSMGGAFAGFKGSCTVLHRCTNTLGKDIAKWMATKLVTLE